MSQNCGHDERWAKNPAYRSAKETPANARFLFFCGFDEDALDAQGFEFPRRFRTSR
jgi:hypothetical protein